MHSFLFCFTFLFRSFDNFVVCQGGHTFFRTVLPINFVCNDDFALYTPAIVATHPPFSNLFLRGSSFREAFENIGPVRALFPSVPLLAMTATANSSTRSEIKSRLDMQSPTRVIASPDRRELFVEVRKHPKHDGIAYGHIKDQLLEKGVCCERHIYVQVSLKIIMKMTNFAIASQRHNLFPGIRK